MNITQRFVNTARAVARNRSIAHASFAFVLSRAIVFAVFIVTAQFLIDSRTPEPTTTPTSPYVRLDARNAVQTLRTLASANDAYWYANIAREGYEQQPFENSKQHNWVFFPLFPMAWSALAYLTGEYPLTGMVLSNVCFWGALVMLHKLVSAWGYDDATADRAVMYLALFPTSYFFSLPGTESLFVLLSIGTMYAARRGAWYAAGLLGALGAATRSTGLLLALSLLLLRWRMYGWRWRRDVLALPLVPLGLVLFMLHLYMLTGNALAFVDAQAAWNRQRSMFWTPLLDYLGDPATIMAPWNFKVFNFAAALLSIACCVYFARRRDWSLASYVALSLVLPLSTNNLQALARYVMVVFPVFLTLGDWGRWSRLDTTLRAVFVALLALMAALFVAGYTMAGT